MGETKRPDEIWWCRNCTIDIGDSRGQTRYSSCPYGDYRLANNGCPIDRYSCDAVKGKIKWEKKP